MLESAILGLLSSGIVYLSKRLGWSSGWLNAAIAVILAVLGGLLVTSFPTWWQSAGAVLAASQTFYAFLWRYIQPTANATANS